MAKVTIEYKETMVRIAYVEIDTDIPREELEPWLIEDNFVDEIMEDIALNGWHVEDVLESYVALKEQAV